MIFLFTKTKVCKKLLKYQNFL